MVLDLMPNIQMKYLIFLRGCIAKINIPVPVSGWPPVKKLFIITMG